MSKRSHRETPRNQLLYGGGCGGLRHTHTHEEEEKKIYIYRKGGFLVGVIRVIRKNKMKYTQTSYTDDIFCTLVATQNYWGDKTYSQKLNQTHTHTHTHIHIYSYYYYKYFEKKKETKQREIQEIKKKNYTSNYYFLAILYEPPLHSNFPSFARASKKPSN